MKQNEILFLLGSVVVVVFAWIAFSIVHTSLTSTVSEAVNQAILPIAPTFDTKTLNTLKGKPVVAPQTTIQGPSQNTIVVTPAPPESQQPLATFSAGQASPGGLFQ